MKRAGVALTLDVAAADQAAGVKSLQFSECGKSLQLRAMVFHNGRLVGHGGRQVLTSISPEDVDLSDARSVGKGSSGTVHLAVHRPTGQPIAIKSIPMDSRERRNEIESELTVLGAGMESDHIVRSFGAYWDADASRICIPMEWMSYSLHDLLTFAQGLPEEQLRSITFQILQGLSFLHNARRVIHRDVKPKNVLINQDGVVKLGDFGISKVVRTLEVSNTYVGTAMYMAPERLTTGEYDYTCDVWSLGITAVSCALGQPPWSDEVSPYAVLQFIKEGALPKLPARFSAAAHDFVARCLERDATKRVACAELLRHPWLAGVTEESARADVKLLVNHITNHAMNAAVKQEEVKADETAVRDRILSGLDLAL